jgi:hypothetical protein
MSNDISHREKAGVRPDHLIEQRPMAPAIKSLSPKDKTARSWCAIPALTAWGSLCQKRPKTLNRTMPLDQPGAPSWPVLLVFLR